MPAVRSGIVTDFEELMTGAPSEVATLYGRCREEPPFWSDRVAGWVVSRHADVSRVLKDESTFPPLTSGTGTTSVYGRTVLQMTGEEHRRKVAPLARRLRNPRVLEADVRQVAASVFERMLATVPDGVEVDLRERLFSRFPMTVVARLMGLEEAAGFRELYGTVVAAATSNMQGDPEIAARGEAARAAAYDMLRPSMEARRRAPGDDLLSELVTMDIDGSPLPDGEVLAYALFLFVAGVETTERTLCHLTRHMVDRPEDWQRLAADRQLVLPAIAETLRFTPPVHALTRAVAVDTEISGTPIVAGSKVLAVIAAANRDPNVFDDPEVFRIDRFRDNPIREFTAASLSLAFGTGLHQCTGSLLSRLEMELAVNGMLDRFERISWVGDRPNDRGYVLRAPTEVRVVCHPRA
jgi:cytochrome P450